MCLKIIFYEILLCRGENTAEHKNGGAELVEQLEGPVVYGHLVELQEAAGGLGHHPQQLSHGGQELGQIRRQLLSAN